MFSAVISGFFYYAYIFFYWDFYYIYQVSALVSVVRINLKLLVSIYYVTIC